MIEDEREPPEEREPPTGDEPAGGKKSEANENQANVSASSADVKHATRIKRSEFFKYWMPYHFHPVGKVSDPWTPDNTFLPVNRKYKPLGIASRAWVEYEDYGHQFIRFTVDPTTIPNMWPQSKLFLYFDRPSSTDDYFERLFRLLQFVVIDEGRWEVIHALMRNAAGVQR